LRIQKNLNSPGNSPLAIVMTPHSSECFLNLVGIGRKCSKSNRRHNGINFEIPPICFGIPSPLRATEAFKDMPCELGAGAAEN
jgi:hypothetical protein